MGLDMKACGFGTGPGGLSLPSSRHWPKLSVLLSPCCCCRYCLFGPMANPPKSLLSFAVVAVVCFSASIACAKSQRPITDNEIRDKKNECYADIEAGLWGWQCRTSVIAKENCALRCLSPVCYELIYESDPLEEGEKDYIRSQEYKYCMHKLSIGESLDGIKGAFDY